MRRMLKGLRPKRVSTVAHAIIHTFSQTYTKGSDQIADITVRTGISGCVSG